MAHTLQKVLYTLALACLTVAGMSFAVSAPPEKSTANETARVNQNGMDYVAYVLGAGYWLYITIPEATFMLQYTIYAVEYSSAEFDAILCPAETNGDCINAYYPSYSFFDVSYGTTASLEKTQVTAGTTPTTFVIKNNNVWFSVTLSIHVEVSAVPEPPAGGLGDAGGAGASTAVIFWFWLGAAGLGLCLICCLVYRCCNRQNQTVVIQQNVAPTGDAQLRSDPVKAEFVYLDETIKHQA